jgi:hypothetical protein
MRASIPNMAFWRAGHIFGIGGRPYITTAVFNQEFWFVFI